MAHGDSGSMHLCHFNQCHITGWTKQAKPTDHTHNFMDNLVHHHQPNKSKKQFLSLHFFRIVDYSPPTPSWARNKKLHYRKEHSTSVVLSWCTSWHFSG